MTSKVANSNNSNSKSQQVNVMTDRVWKAPESGRRFTMAEIAQEFLAFKASNGWDACELVVGTDSQSFGRMHRHVTAICAHYQGSGGTYWYVTQDIRVETRGVNRNQVKRDRIFKEVELSLAVTQELQTVHGLNPKVHVDASPPGKGEFTSQFSDTLVGYVTGCGFPCSIKPEAWAATNVANKHTKAISRAQRRAEKLFTPRSERTYGDIA